MEKFTFTEEIYSYVSLLPKRKWKKWFEYIIEFGLYEIQPSVTKREQPIWDNIARQIRQEKAQRYVRQINGQMGGRKHNKKNLSIKKNQNNLETSKKNLEVSKTKQKKLSKNDVCLFCLANGHAYDDQELNSKYQLAVSHPDNWREILKQNF